MRPRTEYHDSRRMLIQLLTEPDDGPVSIGDDLSDRDLEFLKAASAANVLLYLICYTAGFDEAEAMRGIEALEIERHVKEICTL
jgi:hypothetical protein